MKNDYSPYPLVKLPNETQETLYLIKEELKTRKLFSALNEIGLECCYFQPRLDSLILRKLGPNDGTDNTLAIYNAVLDKRCKKIEADNDSIMKQAVKAYQELIIERKKLNAKKSKG